MAWIKSPPALIARFDAVLPADPRVERRQMFGYPCAFLSGNMFMGLYQDTLLLRFSEADRRELTQKHGGFVFEPMAGRPMREYIVLPRAIVNSDGELKGWIARSLAYVAAMPAKVKPAKPRAPKGKPA
jgi:TfoX/Sxy family transcriptional regulator of competence genes